MRKVAGRVLGLHQVHGSCPIRTERQGGRVERDYSGSIKPEDRIGKQRELPSGLKS